MGRRMVALAQGSRSSGGVGNCEKDVQTVVATFTIRDSKLVVSKASVLAYAINRSTTIDNLLISSLGWGDGVYGEPWLRFA